MQCLKSFYCLALCLVAFGLSCSSHRIAPSESKSPTLEDPHVFIQGEFIEDLLLTVLEVLEWEDKRINIMIDHRLWDIIGEATVSGKIKSETPEDIDDFLDSILHPIGLVAVKKEPERGLLRDYYITGSYNKPLD